MKRAVLLISSACLLAFFVLIFVQQIVSSESSKPRELGIPLSDRYPNEPKCRNVWDMAIFNNKLYIGSGDYNLNAGPIDVWYYDIKSKKWQTNATLPDEELSRFLLLDGKLAAPGIDPRDDWNWGNYYILNESGSGWDTIRKIPGGMHTFDMVSFQGELFAGIDVKKGGTPILSSQDNGVTYKTVPMKKDGALIDTTGAGVIRTNDFFVQKDNLYATFWYENTRDKSLTYDLYRYENGEFVFFNAALNSKIKMLLLWNNLIGGKTVYKDTVFFATGFLYATNDMKDFTEIPFPNSETVWDLFSDGAGLYALCSKEKESGDYTVSVWKNETGLSQDFKEILQFDYPIPAISFVMTADVCYFGMGQKDGGNPMNGMVVQMKLPTD